MFTFYNTSYIYYEKIKNATNNMILLVLLCFIILIYLKLLLNKNKILIVDNFNPSNIWTINKEMNIKKHKNGIIIIDDFYKYPHKIRDYALKQEFKLHKTLYETQYLDTKFSSSNNKNFIKNLETIEKKKINYAIWDINNRKESNGYLQFLTKEGKPQIHSDGLQRAGIVYLNPKPHNNSGTAFFKHKETNSIHETLETLKYINPDLKNRNKWKKHFYCKNRFNRAIFFDGNMYHAGMNGFGDKLENARLYQTFFYNFES